MKTASFRVAFGLISLQITFSTAQAANEMSAEILAVQIRDQGYACEKALSAKGSEILKAA